MYVCSRGNRFALAFFFSSRSLRPPRGRLDRRGADFLYAPARFAAWCARRFAAVGVSARIFGIDHDPRLAVLATRRCELEKSVTIIHGNALDLDATPCEIDWFVSNHLLHHLADAEVTKLLTCAAQRARCGIIMNDLIRRKISLIEFSLLCRALKPLGHTYHDGMVSILRSFTRSELEALVTGAGLSAKTRIRSSGIGHQAILINCRC